MMILLDFTNKKQKKELTWKVKNFYTTLKTLLRIHTSVLNTVRISTQYTGSMTSSARKQQELTDAEFNEMTALKNAINHDITQVVPEKMEEFTAYLVRSLREKGG